MKYIFSSVVLLCVSFFGYNKNFFNQSSSINQKPLTNDTAKKYIFLTFDDGPQNGTTAVFDVLKKQAVKGTFFMVGLHLKIKTDGKKLVDSIKQAYPQTLLANHSQTHAYGKYASFYRHSDKALLDFLTAQKALSVQDKIIRLPGNSAWVQSDKMKASAMVKSVCKKLDSAGYSVIGWDVEWNFNHKTAAPVQTPEKMLSIVENALTKNEVHAKNCIVILSHDRMFRNQNYTDSLYKFIGLLKQNPNYVFETIDHYPDLKPLRDMQ
jgi:peptidoglycan/xylan/chitin deacetylase (PgdA/CDA1 family)